MESENAHKAECKNKRSERIRQQSVLNVCNNILFSDEDAKNNLKADEHSNIAAKGSSQQTDPNNPKGHDPNPEVKKKEIPPKKKKKKCLLL